MSLNGLSISQCTACESPSCYSGYSDLLSCTLVPGTRYLVSSTLVNLRNPLLTRIQTNFQAYDNSKLALVDFPVLTRIGTLTIHDNPLLTYVSCASLATVQGSLRLRYSSSLTYATFPKLSLVSSTVDFCQNSGSFIVPNPTSGTALSPGLTSGTYKGQSQCFYGNGSASCTSYVTCP